MTEGDGGIRRIEDATSPEGFRAPYAVEVAREDAPFRSPRSYLWYLPLTALVIIDIVLWRVTFIATSPGRWIALFFALALIVPAFPVAARCPVED